MQHSYYLQVNKIWHTFGIQSFKTWWFDFDSHKSKFVICQIPKFCSNGKQGIKAKAHTSVAGELGESCSSWNTKAEW
jgi:hypothetical protein